MLERNTVDTLVRPGCWLQLADQGVGLLLQVVHAEAGAVLDHELEAAGNAQARDRRCAEHLHRPVLDLRLPRLSQPGHDRVGAQVRRVCRFSNGSRTMNIEPRLEP